jgi:tRNA modification GTPase
MHGDTIFALSSGLPPAGIAVVRISGPGAQAALVALAGKCPAPRRASHRQLRDPETHEPLDDGLALWFPGPTTATGEDLAELHLHGGRAVVQAVLDCLARQPGLRAASAGEFTRRAFANGRIDLTQAEGLADLLAAETESQRAAALALAEGGLGAKVADWQGALLAAAARIEADLDFSDEDDVAGAPEKSGIEVLANDMAALLLNPPAERLRDGIRVVLSGPPNAGKSSLFNALIGRDAAIVTEIPGTTRDRIEAPVALDGLPLLLIDTAGLRDDAADKVEAIGIERTSAAIAEADIVLWLGDPGECPEGAQLVAAKSDLGPGEGLPVSAVTGEGIDQLKAHILDRARALLPRPGMLALNARHRRILYEVQGEMAGATQASDLLIIAEHLRRARILLFGRFCIGK